MLTTQSSRGIKIATQLARHLLCLVILYYAASPDVKACTDCTIGLPNGTAPALPINGIRGAEWDDASILTSGDACLATILDEPGGVPTPRIIRVYSKRYNRGGPQVGFFFEIPDATQINSANLNGMLTVGERIVLQFDSDKSRGAQLAGGSPLFSRTNDYQIIISHKGGNISGNVQQLEVKIFERDTFCGPNPVWTEITSTVTSNLPVVAVRNDQLGTPGYSAEIEIPLALLGTPTSDMGFAFAVINDTGSCATQVCDGYATAFPNTPNLPITNMVNPVTVGCTGFGNWVVPDEWGTATFGPAGGAVTVDRTPDYSSNDGLKVFECNSTTPNYTWYKTKPCRARLEARLTNTTGVTQTRNLLFLWAQFGSGDPLNYTFVSLVKNVSVPVGINVGPFLAFTLPQLWENMPTGAPAHPCVRVYVLPTAFVAAFPESRFATISTRQDVLDMMAAYCLGQDQWTQKNISGSATVDLCPDLSCRIASNDMKDVEPEAGNMRVEVAAAQPLSDPLQSSRTIVTTDNGPLLRARALLPVVSAAPGAESPPLPQYTDNRPPIVAKPGTNVLMADDEFRLFSRNNVIVQVHTYGFSTPSSTQLPRYNFIEDLGSITQLVPAEMLAQLGEVPFQFNVVNAAVGRTIFHTVDVFIPAQVSRAQIGLDTRRTVYAADEKRVVFGFVRLPGKRNTGGEFKRWGLSLHAGGSFPHSGFNTAFNPGPNVGVDLEYRVNNRFSLELIYTFHRFKGETFDFSGVPIRVDDLNLHQFSFNGKVYGSTSPVRPFFNFGVGAYKFDPGDTHGGINVGGGLQFDLTPTIAIDVMYNFHNVFTPGSDVKFSTAQGGVRFRF
jgi:hypothetical protein